MTSILENSLLTSFSNCSLQKTEELVPFMLPFCFNFQSILNQKHPLPRILDTFRSVYATLITTVSTIHIFKIHGEISGKIFGGISIEDLPEKFLKNLGEISKGIPGKKS